MDKKKTAVEWLIQEFELKYPFLMEDGMINQAKAMEMQYIMDAFIKGELNYLSKEIQTPKDYYNETFGS